jgi:predicted amidohydrolase
LADRLEDDFVTKFQARLFDAWVITDNRYGKEDNKHWPGLIVVTDPLGEVLSAEQGQEQYLNHELRFADTGSLLQGIIRNVWVKSRLTVHVLRNLRKAMAHL